MQIITLTTDWQLRDYYTGVVKGTLYKACPEATVVDLAHEIPPFNIRHAAFVVRNTYQHFPEGTIHLIAIMSHSEQATSTPLLVEHNHHFFVLSDTGMISLIFPDQPRAVYRIKESSPQTFPVLNEFIPVVVSLVSGKKPEEIGVKTEEYLTNTPVRAAIEESVITGSVVYIDSFRNAITNIQKKLFDRIGKKRPFVIHPGSKHFQINRINEDYHHVDPGDIFAVFNTLDLLEIGIYQGNAAELLGLDIHSAIRITFKD
jgi:S-adenosyl-L-methionine hydrolase (adenosine-forming)